MDEEYKVVVVDDDPCQLDFNRDRLEARGYDVDPYLCPSKALEHLEDADAVLTDYNMPGMNGYQLWEELKDTNPEMPILFLTGSPDEVLEESAEIERDEVFSKENLMETYDQIADAL